MASRSRLGWSGVPLTSVFLEIPESRWVGSNDLAFGIRDNYPVTEGHTLVITRRVVLTWFDARDDEQMAALPLIDQVKGDLDRELAPDGYTSSPTDFAHASAAFTVPAATTRPSGPSFTNPSTQRNVFSLGSPSPLVGPW